MVQETRAVSDVVGLARRLRRLSPGKWTEADLRTMAAREGWEWVDDDQGPRLRAEEGFGEGLLGVVDEFLERHVTTEEYVGLRFLLEEVEGDTCLRPPVSGLPGTTSSTTDSP